MSLQRTLKCGAAAGALVSALAAAGSAYAQSTTTLDEVVITAERRDSTLQRTAVAVTAVNAQALAQSNVVSVVDLNGLVPSLTVSRNNGLQRVIAIRGVGYETAQNISSQPGVAYFIDGVYIANNIATGLDLVDVERLEVLRGPQSTLYAQSATGGVINVITAQPKLGEWSGAASASYGNYNLFKGAASVNVPIGDSLAVRASVEGFKHDGFATVPQLGNYDLDNRDDTVAKISGLWKPTDNFSANLTYQHFTQKSHGSAQKELRDPLSDPRLISQDYRGSTDLTFDLASLTLKYKLPFAELKFQGAYQDMESLQKADNDRLDFATLGSYDVYPRSDILNTAKTQEVTLTSTTDTKFDWIVGAFFLQQDARQITLEYQGRTPVPAVLPILEAVPPGGNPSNLAYASDATLNRRSGAVFGQGTWHATDRLRFTAGARYSDDRFKNSQATFFSATRSRFTHKDTTTTGKLMVEYDLAPSLLTYATISRGYKPGGVNINSTPVLVGRSFDAELVNAYEVGSKGRFFDNRLQLNAAGFYYDYKNFQYQEEDPAPFQGGVDNIPKAKIYGVELEGAYIITPSLKMNGNVTLLDGEFEGDYLALDALAASRGTAIATSRGISVFSPAGRAIRLSQIQNVNGNKPPKLPGVSATVAFEHSYHTPWGDVLNSRLEVIYRGEYEYRIFNTSGIDTVPSYTLVNLNFTYQPEAKPIELGLTISNLFNNDAINSRFSDPFGVGSTSNTYVPPRQVFGTLKVKF